MLEVGIAHFTWYDPRTTAVALRTITADDVRYCLFDARRALLLVRARTGAPFDFLFFLLPMCRD